MSFTLQATLAILDKLDIETEKPTEEEVARKFGWEDDYLADNLSFWQRVKPRIFSLFDEPHSSTCARVSQNRPFFVCFISLQSVDKTSILLITFTPFLTFYSPS